MPPCAGTGEVARAVTLVPVLCYHRVGDPVPGPVGRYSTTAAQFDEQLSWLADHGYTGLTVPEYAVSLTRGSALPTKPVVITVDDGYLDFRTTALPILERHGFPVTLYVPTGLVGTDGAAAPEVGWPDLLDWGDLSQLLDSGVVIGSHAHTHCELDVMPRNRARREIEHSKALLEDRLQTPIETLAYPYGYHSATTRRLAQQAGYTSACAVKNCYSHLADDVWSIARLLVEGDLDLVAFAALVAGHGAAPAPRRQRLRTRGWRAARRARSIAVERRAAWAPPPGADEQAAPVAVLDLDLSRSIPAFDGAAGGAPYRSATALVRLHGSTLGMLHCPTDGGRLAAIELANAAWHGFGEQIQRHLTADGLGARHGPRSLLSGLDPRCPSRAVPAAPPFTTVVIATYDRPVRLAACIDSLLAMAPPDLEVVVVDNAPHLPGTRQVLDRYGEQPHIRYVPQPRRGVSAARNLGLAEARGERVAFIDDDVLVDNGYLHALHRAFGATADVTCVTGLILPAELETPAQVRMEQYGGFNKGYQPRVFDLTEHRVDDLLYPYRVGMYGSGANVAFQTEALRALGGFDEHLGVGTATNGGEDLDIMLRVILGGGRLVYSPDALVWHFHRRDDHDAARQIFRYGVALSAVFTKHACGDRRVLLDILARLPRGLVYLLHPASAKNASRRGTSYPLRLVLLEVAGMGLGPVAYLRSRWAASPGRRVTRNRGSVTGNTAAEVAAAADRGVH